MPKKGAAMPKKGGGRGGGVRKRVQAGGASAQDHSHADAEHSDGGFNDDDEDDGFDLGSGSDEARPGVASRHGGGDVIEFPGPERDAAADDDDEGTTGVGRVKKSGGFQALGLSPAVHQSVMRKGYRVPTPIQRKAIPPILAGQDVVAMARTGSGKTAAFLLPMFDRLHGHSTTVGVRAAVLSPTRELALQTHKFCVELSHFVTPKLRFCLLVGGDSMEDQFAMLAANPDAIIATPGRLQVTGGRGGGQRVRVPSPTRTGLRHVPAPPRLTPIDVCVSPRPTPTLIPSVAAFSPRSTSCWTRSCLSPAWSTWCSTRRTVCSRWASPPRSTPSWPPCPRAGRRSSSQPRCRLYSQTSHGPRCMTR